MAFASRDAIRAAITAGRVQRWHFAKTGSAGNETPEAAGQWVSYYLATGTPGAGAAPTAYANLTDFSGSVNNTNVSPGNRYLTDVVVCSTQTGTLMVYDRLGHIGTSASPDNHTYAANAKTVTTSALPRSMGTNDLNNVECWIELTEATDTTAPKMTLSSYTNQAGTAARAGAEITFPAVATNVGWARKMPLQAGDKGVQAVSTITVGTASASTGKFNLFLARPLAYVPIATANVATRLELTQLPRVYDGSSVFFMFMATGTSVADFWGELTFAYDA
jgi:hypothetical protein